jgi:hypothetical protein
MIATPGKDSERKASDSGLSNQIAMDGWSDPKMVGQWMEVGMVVDLAVVE